MTQFKFLVTRRVVLPTTFIAMLAAFHSQAQRTNARGFENVTTEFTQAIINKDLEAIVATYSDPVLYRDQLYGVSDHFSHTDLKAMFGAFFGANSAWKLSLVSMAIDQENEMMMLKLDIVDPEGEMSEYAGWFRFDRDKIVEQLDFSMYPIKDLLESPRFVEYFEEEQLEICSKGQ